MARKSAKPVEGLQLQNGQGEQVMVWKATMPFSVEEHEQLAVKLQMEHERSGMKIILVPHSVDVEVTGVAADAGNTGAGASGEEDKDPPGESGD